MSDGEDCPPKKLENVPTEKKTFQCVNLNRTNNPGYKHDAKYYQTRGDID